MFKELKKIAWFLSEKKQQLYISVLRRKIKVASLEETINKIKKDNCSISRFGDGEFYIIEGNNIGFQKYNKTLSERLKEVFLSNDSNHFVCVTNALNPKNYKEYTKKQKKWIKNNFKRTIFIRLKYFDYEKLYYNALISRFWIPFKDKNRAKKVAESLKKVWQGRDVVIVEGEKTRMGVGNDLLDGTKSVKRILCPAENAFEKYDKILDCCIKMPKDSLFLIALGPTATVLSYDLYKSGYQALDIGHIDLEYEWMKMGVVEQVNLPNKYVNELDGGRTVEDVKNSKYFKEIVARIID